MDMLKYSAIKSYVDWNKTSSYQMFFKYTFIM